MVNSYELIFFEKSIDKPAYMVYNKDTIKKERGKQNDDSKRIKGNA